MKDYGKRLRAMGLTDTQVATLLSGWPIDGIEAVLRGERKPPADHSIGRAASARGCD
ncbi:MAG: hypothetical protein ACLQNE_01630 [Thermoguttaceae bacterium]